MESKKTFYVTTPIYYPNDIPHLGHAYTTIAADILARWNTLLGKEVFFLTGTDEHGKKIEETAQKNGKKPKEFVDSLIPEFKKAWGALNIEYDRFIRTSDLDHEQVVQDILERVNKKGDIYKGVYSGLYCTACEAYYTEKDAKDNSCPMHNKPLENLEEESYFFRLSKYKNKILELYQKNPEFISPEYRKQEIINRINEGLQDLSISRKNLKWGIPLPFDESHCCYVWFDALTNYLTGVGYNKDEKLFKKFWPADLHIVGKDILWFHVVIWPAILFSAGIELPKKIFAHGWWLVENEKMGKSAGNAINIEYLVSIAGADSARYFLFRSTPFGQEGNFSNSTLIERHNNELADKLGNLISRVSNLAEKIGLEKTDIIGTEKLTNNIKVSLENLEFDRALNEIFAFIDFCNTYVQEKKPWLNSDKKVVYQLCNAIKDIAILLSPFIPETSEKIAENFNFEISQKSLSSQLQITKIKKAPILFKKIEEKKEEANREIKSVKKPETIINIKETVKDKVEKEIKDKKMEKEEISKKPIITYEEFSKLDLKIGKILSVKDHPEADKLLILEVDFGDNDKRTIVAGLKQHYKKEYLIEKKAVFVANLKPANLRGIESQGMILAATDKENNKVIFLTTEKEVKEGSKIK